MSAGQVAKYAAPVRTGRQAWAQSTPHEGCWARRCPISLPRLLIRTLSQTNNPPACFRAFPSSIIYFFFLPAPFGKLVERRLWWPFTILTENRFLLPIYFQAILLSPACMRLHLFFQYPLPGAAPHLTSLQSQVSVWQKTAEFGLDSPHNQTMPAFPPFPPSASLFGEQTGDLRSHWALLNRQSCLWW